MNRDFKGVWIPKDIWLCKELSALDRVMLAEINSLDGENHCTASNEYFAEFCGVGVATITRSISKLIEMGFVEKVNFDGRSRILKVIELPNQNDEATQSKRLTNNIENNTDNNTKDIITINSNNKTGNALYMNDDFDDHCYSPKELRNDFLGSAGKTKKKETGKSGKNLYSKCTDEILVFAESLELQELLKQYLDMRLSMKDKPLYFNQWKALLTKLATIADENPSMSKVDIVKQSLEKGWASFYTISSNSRNNDIQSIASEFGMVESYRTRPEDISDVEY